MTINQLEKELKENKLSSIYLLYGQERYLLDNVVKKIKKSFGNLVDGLNYIKIDNSAIDNIISEIQTPAFGFERKLIIIKNTDLLKKQSKKKNQLIIDKIEKISEYIENNKDEIKDHNVIVFIEDDIEKNKLYKTIEKIGIVCNFEPEKPQELSNRIKYICNAYSVNIDNPTLAYFIECCGKNVAKSLEVLRNLIYAKEPIQKILITLYNHFKKLYIVKLCEKYKKDIQENLNLKPNQTFLVSKYKKQAGYFKEDELYNILKQFINLDEKYKDGDIDLNIGIEAVICGYCS